MVGALYWRHVGPLQIGTYIDSDGRKRLTIRGECAVSSEADVITAIRAVCACIEHSTEHPTDLLSPIAPP